MWRTTIAPFESLGKKFRKTYLSNKSQSLNQVEGGWDEDGKGLSNWDKWTEDPSHTTDGSSGKVFFFLFEKIYLGWKGVSGQLPQVQGGCAARSWHGSWRLSRVRRLVPHRPWGSRSCQSWGGSPRFPAGTAKPVGGNVFVEICNHSYIYSHFHSWVGKEKMILIKSIMCPSLPSM